MLGGVAIRLVLAEDSFLVREGVRRLLETQSELEVVATCGDLDSLLAAVEAERPDVVLTDIRMPPTGLDEGIQAAGRLRETSPEVGVVVLSQYVAARLRARAARGRLGAARLSPQGAGRGPRPARRGDPRRRGRRLGHRPEGRRGAGRRRARARALAARRAHAARARRAARDGAGQEQRGDRRSARDHRALGREVRPSIFAKLRLTWEENVHRRVKAVLLYLGEDAGCERDGARDTGPAGRGCE